MTCFTLAAMTITSFQKTCATWRQWVVSRDRGIIPNHSIWAVPWPLPIKSGIAGAGQATLSIVQPWMQSLKWLGTIPNAFPIGKVPKRTCTCRDVFVNCTNPWNAWIPTMHRKRLAITLGMRHIMPIGITHNWPIGIPKFWRCKRSNPKTIWDKYRKAVFPFISSNYGKCVFTQTFFARALPCLLIAEVLSHDDGLAYGLQSKSDASSRQWD